MLPNFDDTYICTFIHFDEIHEEELFLRSSSPPPNLMDQWFGQHNSDIRISSLLVCRRRVGREESLSRRSDSASD